MHRTKQFYILQIIIMNKIILYLLFPAMLWQGSEIYAQKRNTDLGIAVMSFNIRNSNAKDDLNSWENRRNWVGDLIHFYQPDLIGLQEVLHPQLGDLLERLPEYGYIGVARNDGKTEGEYSPIFYNKKRFELIKSATFWLAEDTEKPNKSWGATYRIVTWGQLKDKNTGDHFFLFNTHFDNREKAREESARLLLEKVGQIAGSQPAIITGDFNSNSQSIPYQILTERKGKKGFWDTRLLAKSWYGPLWTFHSFGKVPVESREQIDYIFSNRKVTVEQYVSISEQRGEVFPSDHLPILARIQF